MSRRMTSREGDRIDRIALEVYGRTAGTTEAILDANPGLETMPPYLPAGIHIILPEVEVEPVKPMVRLWD